jgi:hypothetical protein
MLAAISSTCARSSEGSVGDIQNPERTFAMLPGSNGGQE